MLFIALIKRIEVITDHHFHHFEYGSPVSELVMRRMTESIGREIVLKLHGEYGSPVSKLVMRRMIERIGREIVLIKLHCMFKD